MSLSSRIAIKRQEKVREGTALTNAQFAHVLERMRSGILAIIDTGKWTEEQIRTWYRYEQMLNPSPPVEEDSTITAAEVRRAIEVLTG